MRGGTGRRVKECLKIDLPLHFSSFLSSWSPGVVMTTETHPFCPSTRTKTGWCEWGLFSD